MYILPQCGRERGSKQREMRYLLRDVPGGPRHLLSGSLAKKIQLDCGPGANCPFTGKTRERRTHSTIHGDEFSKIQNGGHPRNERPCFSNNNKNDKDGEKVGERSDFKRFLRPINQTQCANYVWILI